jgi:pimeloyl-ACP methyl ester carboxylesterase
MHAPSRRPDLRIASHAALFACLAAVGSSCAIFGLKQQVAQIAAHGLVSVKVEAMAPGAPTYAVAWTTGADGKPETIGMQPLGEDGIASFLLLNHRRYGIGAWSDLDKNKVYDGGEPAASVTDVQPVPLDDTFDSGKLLTLKLDKSNGLPPGQSFTVPDTESDMGDAMAVHIGDVVNLDDPRFTAENGDMGMWRPFDFLKKFGIGLYFLQPYDPDKLPVIFVYGISGSPQDWRPMIEALDTTKVQPWFYHYPGGMRVERSANGLVSEILLLKRRYHLPKVAIVAHSMGGILTYGAIQSLAEQAGTNFVSHYVTISVPWGGHEAAAKGVQRLNYPVPSWRDMEPGSDYLRSMLSHPLPASTKHDLIFGFKSTGGIGLPDDNDGTVGVGSQLVLQVQEAAHRVYGLPLSHSEILRSPDTRRLVEQALRVP